MLDVSGKMSPVQSEALDSQLRKCFTSRLLSHFRVHASRRVAQNIQKTGPQGSTCNKIIDFLLHRGYSQVPRHWRVLVAGTQR